MHWVNCHCSQSPHPYIIKHYIIVFEEGWILLWAIQFCADFSCKNTWAPLQINQLSLPYIETGFGGDLISLIWLVIYTFSNDFPLTSLLHSGGVPCRGSRGLSRSGATTATHPPAGATLGTKAAFGLPTCPGHSKMEHSVAMVAPEAGSQNWGGGDGGNHFHGWSTAPWALFSDFLAGL